MRSIVRLFSVVSFFGLVGISFAQSPQQQAGALIAKGEFFAAERIIAPIATAKGADAVSLHQLSQIRLAQQRTDEAIKLAERATKLDSSKADYFSQLGRAYAQQAAEAGGGFVIDRVRRSMERALKLDPNHLPALTGLARLYANAPARDGGDFKKAREYAAKIAAIDPVEGELEMGNIEQRLGKFQVALDHFEKAAQLSPNHPTAILSAGMVLVLLDRKIEARVKFNELLRIDPSMTAAREAIRQLDEPPMPVR